MTDIHARIKRLREAQSLSLEALAKKAGVSWQAAQQWEKPNGTAPKRARLAKVAEALKTTAGYLMSGYSDTQENNVRHLAQPVAPYQLRQNHPDIAAVVAIMESTDDRGRAMALAAVKVALEGHSPTVANAAQ